MTELAARLKYPAEWVGSGIYTITDAARLLRVPRSRLFTWAVGRSGKGDAAHPPLFRTDLPSVNGYHALSFLDLVEFAFVRDFRQHGISLQAIRKSLEVATDLLGTPHHPLCLKRFETDGATIFARVYDEFQEEKLIDLLRRQVVFKAVFDPLLLQLEHDEVAEKVIRWWPLGKTGAIVLDPKRSFGAPILSESGVPTRALYEASLSGDTIVEIADWYEVPVSHVAEAVEFEQGLAA